MKKKLSFKNWIISLLALLLALVLLLMGLMYAVDPFLQFRVRDGVYMLNPRYVNPGLLKNMDYDTVLLGSSMTQNFDMELFAADLDVQPVKIATGGLGPLETVNFLKLADSLGKAGRYYVCIDLHSFAQSGDTLSTPAHLMEDDLLSRLRYLISYEAWFSFLPVDMGFALLHALDVELPLKFRLACSVHDVGNWEMDFDYGEDVVLAGYSADFAVSELELEGMEQRLRRNMDMLLDAAAGLEGEVSFFLPPYSALYWLSHSAQLPLLLDARDYFIERANALGMQVHDFQSEPLTTDLNNYKDSTHYRGEINDYMSRCFAEGSCLAGSDDIAANRAALLENIAAFEEKYKDILK